ncbi:hypothetical protein O3M35_002607 [Rhynocoris fuscipes]|uniref:Myosin light chain kinase, smooth muscle n=1 Tax=Rhynocoris fuscipes TaxID=488301 RepID=A0AAW1CTK4_9HEMI
MPHLTSPKENWVPDPPAGRPTAVVIHPGTVRVAWSSPHYDGGSKITGYSVQMSTDQGDSWTTVKDMCYSLSHTLTNLPQVQTCVFRVCSHNIHGSSEPSLESMPLALSQQEEAREEVHFEDGNLFPLKFTTLEELGKGRYGTVHRVKERNTGKEYAAKTVRCIKKEDREKAQEEVQIMNSLKHPKLLQIIGAYENPRDVILVVEYISGGELFERVVADDFTLTEKDCILFMRQICEGVEYMHTQSVVHLDLKPENIMCINRDSHEIKLIDFGLAQRLKPDSQVRVLFGTPEFIAPEIINYEPIGTQTDMWSVGVICYVLLSGLSPFMGDTDAETFANITRADFDFEDEAFDSISEEAKEFISALLVKRKEKRLTASECLSHRWLCQEDTAMSQVKLCTDKLKKFIIRRKWQKTGNAIRALGRMANLSAATRKGIHISGSGGNGVAITGNRMTNINDIASGSEKQRGRQCSERSDSGFSDCSTTGSLSTTNPSSLLADKKYSITEEIEDSMRQITTNEEKLCCEGLKKNQKSTTSRHMAGNNFKKSKNENVQKAFEFWNR